MSEGGPVTSHGTDPRLPYALFGCSMPTKATFLASLAWILDLLGLPRFFRFLAGASRTRQNSALLWCRRVDSCSASGGSAAAFLAYLLSTPYGASSGPPLKTKHTQHTLWFRLSDRFIACSLDKGARDACSVRTTEFEQIKGN